MSNIDAFLSMLAHSEGTALIGDRGYNVLVGSTIRQPLLFGSYKDHPRTKIQLKPDLVSTAAGRYQILVRFFDAYSKQLNLQDFSPRSQDAIALQMIRERDAIKDIEAGRFDVAVEKVKGIWASLPGAGYNQHENQLADLRDAFVREGGQIA